MTFTQIYNKEFTSTIRWHFYGSMWLIWIDAYSKYKGAKQVSKSNKYNTAKTQRNYCHAWRPSSNCIKQWNFIPFNRIRRILESTQNPGYPISTVQSCYKRKGRKYRKNLQTCTSVEIRSNLVQYRSDISKQIQYRKRRSSFPSTLLYSNILYNRTHTF